MDFNIIKCGNCNINVQHCSLGKYVYDHGGEHKLRDNDVIIVWRLFFDCINISGDVVFGFEHVIWHYDDEFIEPISIVLFNDCLWS